MQIAFIENFRESWQGREPWERAVLAVVGIFGIGVFLFLLLALPISNYYQNAQSNLNAASQEALMIDNALRAGVQLQSRQPLRKLTGQEGFEAALQDTAADLGIEIQRMQAEADGVSNMWLEAVEPDLLYSWLMALEREYGIYVTRAEMTGMENSDLLLVQLQLKYTFGA